MLGFFLFWALPLAIGTWLGWGSSLQLTVWDALALSGICIYTLSEMLKSGKKLLEES